VISITGRTLECETSHFLLYSPGGLHDTLEIFRRSGSDQSFKEGSMRGSFHVFHGLDNRFGTISILSAVAIPHLPYDVGYVIIICEVPG
jgi:hypothetical protein